MDGMKEVHDDQIRGSMTRDQILEAMAEIGDDRRVLFVNERFRELMGYPEEAPEGRDLTDLLHPGDVEDGIRFLDRLLGGSVSPSALLRFRMASGEYLPVSVTARAVFGPMGPPRYIASFRDASEKALEDDMMVERQEFERIVIDVSTEFINLPLEGIDEGIITALWRLADATGSDKAYVTTFSDARDMMVRAYEWIREDAVTGPERDGPIPTLVFPWLSERILGGGTVRIARVKDLPLDAGSDRNQMEREGVISLLNIPISYDGEIIGLIGVESTSGERSWSTDMENMLASVGEVFANALSRKRMEERLRFSEERYKSLFDRSPQGIVILDMDGKVMDFNSTMESQYGLVRDDILGKDFREIVPIDLEFMPGLVKLFMDLAEGEKVEPFELRVEHQGRTIWLEIHPGLIRFDDDVKGIQVITLDITRRKEAEAERDLLFYHSVDPQAIAGFDGFFKMINPAWGRCLGWDVSTLLSRPFAEMVHPEDVDGTGKAMSELRSGRAVFGFENRYRCKDGSYRWLSWSAFPLMDRDLILAVARDVTERKLYEEKIESERIRAEFYLDLLSHDIGNIHQGISSWTYFALDAGSDLVRRDLALRRIDELQRRALKLVRNVLLLSRLKGMRLNLVEVDLVAMIRKAAKDVSMLFTDRRFDLRIDPSDASIVIMGEPLMEEIFFNLIQNSYKFVQEDQGEIYFEFFSEEGLVRIKYSDNGPGIPDELKGQVLSRLGRSSKYNNTGIGLSLVKELIDRYGGTLRITDRVRGDYSKGVCFVLDLPTGG